MWRLASLTPATTQNAAFPSTSTSSAAAAGARAASPTDSDVVVVPDAARRAPGGGSGSGGAKGQQQQQQGAGARQPSPDLGDDDLLITGEAGVDARRDLPHTREMCAQHPFSRSAPAAANAARCANCFCFVCDAAAARCEFWGTGARAADHCNAHHEPAWDALRAACRAGNRAHVRACFVGNKLPAVTSVSISGSAGASAGAQAARAQPQPRPAPQPQPQQQQHGHQHHHHQQRPPAPPAPHQQPQQPHHLKQQQHQHQQLPPPPLPVAAAAPPPQPAGPRQMRVSDWLAGTVARMQPQPSPQQPAQPRAAPAPCRLQPMPDPARNPDLLHVGQLRLPIKAAKGTTVAELARRLAPHGLFMRARQAPSDVGDRICLDNLEDATWDSAKGKQRRTHLKLLPLAPPPGEAAEPSRRRVRPVTVVHHDGLEAPTTIGVEGAPFAAAWVGRGWSQRCGAVQGRHTLNTRSQRAVPPPLADFLQPSPLPPSPPSHLQRHNQQSTRTRASTTSSPACAAGSAPSSTRRRRTCASARARSSAASRPTRLRSSATGASATRTSAASTRERFVCLCLFFARAH